MSGGLLADLVVKSNMSHHTISTVASRFIRSGTDDRVVAPPSDNTLSDADFGEFEKAFDAEPGIPPVVLLLSPT